MSRTILVTGGSGFIGSHVVKLLRDRGDRVRVLDAYVEQVHGPEPAHSVPDGVELVTGDLRNDAITRRALLDVDAVVHLASYVGVGQSQYQVCEYVSANDMGTATLLQAMLERRRSFDKLVVASSMSVYGEGSYFCKTCGTQDVPLRAYPQAPWDHVCRYCLSTLLSRATCEEKPLRPTSVYAVTKRSQEELCLAVGGAYRIPTTALRFFNVYGPGQALSNPYTGAVAIFASRLLNGQPPLLFEDGKQTRDFIHVSDVARAVVIALDDHSEMQDVWNVGTGVATSMLTLASRLADLMSGPQPEIIGKGRAGDIRHCYADVEKAKRKGFTAQVRLAEGLRDLVPYLRKQCPVDGALRAKEELEVRGLVA